jgi:rhodanese-related sulfurtransferase
MGSRPTPPTKRRSLDDLLDAARERIRRYEPAEALAAVQAGALLVDIRAGTSRDRDGIVPGSLHIPRTVLEWRFDLDSLPNPYLNGLDEPVILICDHGCSTILAAATLVELGWRNAGDVIGGYEAWAAAGLPTGPAPLRSHPAGAPVGMDPPDP